MDGCTVKKTIVGLLTNDDDTVLVEEKGGHPN